MPMKSFEESTAASLRTLTTIVVVLSVFLGLSLGAATYAVIRGSNAISRVSAVAAEQGVEARRAAVLAREQGRDARRAADLARVVAAQRAQTILRLCRDQNARHARTIVELDQILRRARRAAPPLRRAQIEESRASTVLLINQLAPFEDCAQQLRLDSSK